MRHLLKEFSTKAKGINYHYTLSKGPCLKITVTGTAEEEINSPQGLMEDFQDF